MPKCPRCDDTGLADSGGTYPWGEPISIPCDCDHYLITAIEKVLDTYKDMEDGEGEPCPDLIRLREALDTFISSCHKRP